MASLSSTATEPFPSSALPKGVCILNDRGQCEAVSHAGCDLLGYRAEELRGRSFHDAVHFSSSSGDDCPLCGLSDEPFEGEEFLRRKDGTLFIARCSGRELSSERQPKRVIEFAEGPSLPAKARESTADLEPENVVADGLRRAVAELADERQRTESLYSFGRALYVTRWGDLDTVLTDQFCISTDSKLALLYRVDAPGRDLLLAASRGLVGSGVAQRVSPGQGSVSEALAARQPLIEDHSSSPIELAGRQIRHILYVPLCDAEDDLGVIVLARTTGRPYSIGDRDFAAHLAELASVALANSMLVGTLERFSQLTRAALNGIIEAIEFADPDGQTLFLNASMRRLNEELGISMRDALFEPDANGFANRTTDPSRYLAEIRKLHADPERGFRTHWELADSGRSFECYTAPIRDSLGTLIGRIAVLREKTAERAVQRLQEELTSVVSHELRAPLTSTLGFCNLLLDDQDLTDRERLDYVRTMQTELSRLLGIVDDLLEQHRLEDEGFVLAPVRFDLRELVNEQIGVLSGISAKHSLRVAMPADEDLVVYADRDMLAQVVSNLLSNAIKYSPSGGEIMVQGERLNGSIRLSVADPGVGIPAGLQDRVFTKFSRIESPETVGISGLGLGLALSRNIISAHNGTMGFRSAEGIGSVFWFELPVAPTLHQS